FVTHDVGDLDLDGRELGDLADRHHDRRGLGEPGLPPRESLARQEEQGRRPEDANEKPRQNPDEKRSSHHTAHSLSRRVYPDEMRRAAAGFLVAVVGLSAMAPDSSAAEASRKRPARLKSAPAKPADPESRYVGEPISLDLKDADLKDVLRTFAELTKINIAIDPDVKGSVTVVLNDVPWDQALELILEMNGLGYVLEGRILRVGKPENLLPRG